MDSTEKNLYDFYCFSGKAQSIRYIHNEGYQAVSSNNEKWPQILFSLNKSINPDQLIPAISDDININNYPPYFIAPKDFINQSHSILLKENKFAPVIIWKGMLKNLTENIPIKISESSEIKRLNHSNNLDDFANLVNEELMTSQPVDKSILEELVIHENLSLYGLYYKKILVSTIVGFSFEGITGIYFFATKKAFRGKGFGTLLIQYLLNESWVNGIKKVVIHTSGNALKLYEKLGFQTLSEFVIYRKF